MNKKQFIGCLFSLSFAAISFASPPEPVVKFSEVLKNQYKLPYTISKIDDGSKFWQVQFGPNTVYITPDGSHVIHGELFNVSKGISYTEQAANKYKLSALNGLNDKSTITFEAESAKNTIWVFTDTHCPYCHIFHKEVPKFTSAGINVKYLLYPIQGEESKGFDSNSGILCSDNPKGAMQSVMNSGTYINGNKACEKNVKDVIQTAAKLQVSRTPSIVMPNGTVLEGAYSAKELLPVLNKMSANQ